MRPANLDQTRRWLRRGPAHPGRRDYRAANPDIVRRIRADDAGLDQGGCGDAAACGHRARGALLLPCVVIRGAAVFATQMIFV